MTQGDVLRDVTWLESIDERGGQLTVSRVVFPLVVVLTQDCDLEQEFNKRRSGHEVQDKWLVSVLLAPLYNVEHVYNGEHLSEIQVKMEPIPRKKTPGDYLRNNDRPRYHYLEFTQGVPLVPSVIDFKHYFSATVTYLTEVRSARYVCTLAPLHRENVSQRFSAYLSRIGLP